jgi:hypothetical protein
MGIDARVQDDWILDAAIQTMHTWVRGGPVEKWGYVPKELKAPKFEPRFGYWFPQFLEWAEFKKLSGALYRRELASYRAEVRNMWGEGQSSLSEHAVWTVLWQQGKSPEAIRRLHFTKTGETLEGTIHATALAAGRRLFQLRNWSAQRQVSVPGDVPFRVVRRSPVKLRACA